MKSTACTLVMTSQRRLLTATQNTQQDIIRRSVVTLLPTNELAARRFRLGQHMMVIQIFGSLLPSFISPRFSCTKKQPARHWRSDYCMYQGSFASLDGLSCRESRAQSNLGPARIRKLDSNGNFKTTSLDKCMMARGNLKQNGIAKFPYASFCASLLHSLPRISCFPGVDEIWRRPPSIFST